MGSIQDAVCVYYCCVYRDGQVLYAYNGGDHETENLAALCLERTPPHHKFYFQTMAKRTFGFLVDSGYVYFCIVNDSLGNPGALRFLENLRDGFKKVNKRGPTPGRSGTNLNSIRLQDQLVPVVRSLIASLERFSQSGTEWLAESSSPYRGDLSSSPCDNVNGQMEGGASTKAPLLGKPSKQDKKKTKEHIITMREVELEEQRRSTDRVGRIDSGAVNPNGKATIASPVSQWNDFSSTRIKANSQNLQQKWCRQVRIILAIDAVVCLVLLVIWLVICHGVECIR